MQRVNFLSSVSFCVFLSSFLSSLCFLSLIKQNNTTMKKYTFAPFVSIMGNFEEFYLFGFNAV
jgi:hypothetical protein